MRLLFGLLLAGTAAIAGCATVPPAASAAAVASSGVCGTYGYVDVNNDGWISGDEWNTFRTSACRAWDMNRDGRVDRTEFEYWSAFDTNGDGFLSADEYWSAAAWS